MQGVFCLVPDRRKQRQGGYRFRIHIFLQNPLDGIDRMCYTTNAEKEPGFFFLCPKKRESQLEVYTMRVRITLACTECKQRNYNMTKEKKNHPERMETKKYCPFCKKHTMHKETK